MADGEITFCAGTSELLELWYIFKGFINYCNTKTLSRTLATWLDRIN
jgi:high-affinity Fe2+/Pb2+ permease